MNFDCLPDGWVQAEINDTGEYINGFAFKPIDWENEGKPIVRIQNLTSTSKEFNYTTKIIDDKYIIRNGDILVSWSATLDAFLWKGEEAYLNQHIFKVDVNKNIVEKNFLFYLLRHIIAEMVKSEHLHGSTMKHINRKPFLSFPIPLPPLNEQKRIVNKIENLQDKRANVKAELEAIARLIPQFRQSVLASAFRGDLTANWRENNPDVESAELLLEKIKIERRQKWEASELEKMKAQGKIPVNDHWKNKYKEPETVIDVDDLPDIPDSWMWVFFPQLGELNRGKSKHRPRNDSSLYGGKYPFIQTGDIRSANGIITNYSQTYNELGLKQSKLWNKGTLCITIAGNIAETAILNFSACFPDSIVGFIADPSLCDVYFVEYFMRTIKNDLEQFAPATAQKNINIGILNLVKIPLAPLEEQKEIVRKIETAFNFADHIEREIKTVLEQLENLNQSILAKAFRGELVPQIPTDEPASMLLAKIKQMQGKLNLKRAAVK